MGCGGGVSDGDRFEGEEAQPTRLVVMTYNVLCSFCNREAYDPWEERLEYFHNIFERYAPDIIGTQELFNATEVSEILAGNLAYKALYFHDPEEQWLVDYPDAAIFYHKSRFEVVEKGFYWLGETPDTPWTGGWADTNLWRLVAWAHFRQKEDGREFYFASTHFDNNSPNQEMSAPVFLERSEPWANNMPAILVGDFNSKPGSEAFGILTGGVEIGGFSIVDSLTLADEWLVDSNQELAPPYDLANRIDHIFLAGSQVDWNVSRWLADLHVYGALDRYPSDHVPIVVELEF
jgi:endonuclease/exonuclease/phosphatase family metal-dependent hydrolase